MSPPARLDLDEGNRPVPLHDEVDVPMSVLESALENAPSLALEPTLSDALAELAKCLPGRRHDRQGIAEANEGCHPNQTGRIISFRGARNPELRKSGRADNPDPALTRPDRSARQALSIRNRDPLIFPKKENPGSWRDGTFF